MCSFCGRRVALRYADGTTNAGGVEEEEEAAAGGGDGRQQAGLAAAPAGAQAPPAGAQQAGQQGASAAAAAGSASAAAEAVALKDRLVGYDRASAARTTVLDDQSDFFEIDANAWLTGAPRFFYGDGVMKQH